MNRINPKPFVDPEHDLTWWRDSAINLQHEKSKLSSEVKRLEQELETAKKLLLDEATNNLNR